MLHIADSFDHHQYPALRSPPNNASACFFAFSRKSAMLEFFVCTAKAAKFSG